MEMFYQKCCSDVHLTFRLNFETEIVFELFRQIIPFRILQKDLPSQKFFRTPFNGAMLA